MTAQSNAPTVIIKKVKKVQGGGHHGGAWKVAYADFVTAMMAFFLLMWLLNATTEKQRKGIADYFSPTIPVSRVSGGGEGSFNGDSVFTEETLAQTGIGGVPTRIDTDNAEEAARAQETAALEALGETLTARSGESMVDDGVLRHVVTRVTDEGLLIELFDIVGDPLFTDGTAEPAPVLRDLAAMMTEVFALVTNDLAIDGYVQSQPVVLADNRNWELSADRADTTRKLLENAGFSPDRVRRVTGHADRQPASADPMAIRNNRIVLVLLRSGS
ncbi:MAG TPA: chemotaxis protein MotB [Rhodobacteraceae bacterium]|nr:chemotaxis protein MotB [Paracoccaceae bacterium]